MNKFSLQRNRTGFTARAIFAVLALGLASPNVAKAVAIYDFSLAANGEVGPFSIELTFPDLLPSGGLIVIGLDDPEVTGFSSGTPVDPLASVIGIQVTPTTTLFGVSLNNGGTVVLFTIAFPADFFVFSRTPSDTGTFASIAGTLSSDFILDSTTPIGTLNVSGVPEPGSVVLLGLGLVGVACLRKFRRRSA